MPLPPLGRPSQSPRSWGGRPPPDYRSRSVRWNLFVLVAALMSVLVAMNEARKPANWQWLWSGGPPADREAVDTRQGVSASRSGAAEGPAVVAAGGEPAGQPDGWQQRYLALPQADRRALGELLRAARRGQKPDASTAASWSQLVQRFDEAAASRVAAPPPPVAEAGVVPPPLSPESLGARGELAAEERAALQAAATGQALSDAHRRILAEIQSGIDACDLSAIRDDRVWLPEERQAWFRIFEQLQDGSSAKWPAGSPDEVNHRQLFRQPDVYRGQRVMVRGTARLGYQVPAPPNDLGIARYNVLWLRPADGSNLPIAVYTLDMPAGFPRLELHAQTRLDEPVEVAGVFFKRLLYRAHDGLNSVPLLLAGAPRWSPRPQPPESQIVRIAAALGGWFWLAVGTTAAALAAGMAWLVSWSGRGSVAARSVLDHALADDLAHLHPTVSVAESLRELAERDHDHRV